MCYVSWKGEAESLHRRSSHFDRRMQIWTHSLSLLLMDAVNCISNLPNTNEINDGCVNRSEVDISED